MTAPHPWMLRLEQERREQQEPLVKWMLATGSTRRTVDRWTHPRQAASPRLTDVDALLRLHRMIIPSGKTLMILIVSASNSVTARKVL